MSDHGWARRLYVFVKPPRLGRAKTRLAAEIGSAAIGFYRNSVSGLFDRLGPDPRWKTLAAVDGDGWAKTGWPGQWPEGIERVPQGGGDLGARLRRLLDTAPPGPFIVLGSDAPQIASGQIARAFHALAANDVVLGPAPDGGYWLVGVRRMRGAPRLFQGVRWSTEHALADTIESAGGLRVALLETFEDVDDAASLKRVRPRRSRPAPARLVGRARQPIG